MQKQTDTTQDGEVSGINNDPLECSDNEDESQKPKTKKRIITTNLLTNKQTYTTQGGKIYEITNEPLECSEDISKY